MSPTEVCGLCGLMEATEPHSCRLTFFSLTFFRLYSRLSWTVCFSLFHCLAESITSHGVQCVWLIQPFYRVMIHLANTQNDKYGLIHKRKKSISVIFPWESTCSLGLTLFLLLHFAVPHDWEITVLVQWPSVNVTAEYYYCVFVCVASERWRDIAASSGLFLPSVTVSVLTIKLRGHEVTGGWGVRTSNACDPLNHRDSTTTTDGQSKTRWPATAQTSTPPWFFKRW